MGNGLKLAFVKYIGQISENEFEYKFYYSENIENVWGLDWDVYSPINCEDLTPENSTIDCIENMIFKLKLKTVEDISEYSLEYCTYGMVALSWIDIENLEEYPEDGRCVLFFGMDKKKVQEISEPYLNKKGQ